MATVYRITIDKNGNETSRTLLYHGNDPAEIIKVLGDKRNTFKFRTYDYSEGVIIAENLKLGNFGELDRGNDAGDAENILVLGNYETREIFEDFLGNKKLTYEIPGHPIPSTHIRKNHFSFREFMTRPGTWTFGALALILAGVFAPAAAAPGLILAAAIMMPGLAVLFLIYSIREYVNELWIENEADEGDKTFSNFIKWGWEDLQNWASKHTAQAIIVGLAVGLLVTTLTLTIGFFTGGGAFAVVGGALVATGGGAFAFMAPVFAAIAAPFAAAATAAGAEVSLAALAGASFVLAGLAIPDAFRRLSNWLDGFKDEPPLLGTEEEMNLMSGLGSSMPESIESVSASPKVEEGIGNPLEYTMKVFTGMGRSVSRCLGSFIDDSAKHKKDDDYKPFGGL